MPHLQSHRRRSWITLTTLALTALAALGHWLIGLAREQSWASIQAAAEAERWTELESGLRRWLDKKPRDDKAWMMLGSLLFDRDRQEEALVALGRVRETNEGWTHARTLLAEIAIRRHDLGEAERLLRQAAGRDRRAKEPRAAARLHPRPGAEARRGVLRATGTVRAGSRPAPGSPTASWSPRIESDLRDLSPELEAYYRQTPENPWVRRAWGLFLSLARAGGRGPRPSRIRGLGLRGGSPGAVRPGGMPDGAGRTRGGLSRSSAGSRAGRPMRPGGG